MALLSQPAIMADFEYGDSVVQAVCAVHEVAIGGNANFRSEVCTGESGRHTRYDLFLRKSTGSGIETPEHDGGRFFLNGVHPVPVGVEREMPGPIARGRINEVHGSQGRVASHSQFPDVNTVLSRVGAYN